MSLKKFLNNSAWLLIEQTVKMASGIIVAIYIARYLGPKNYGILSYGLAISSIALPLTKLGLDSILIRDISENQTKSNIYLGTSALLMIISGFLIFLTILLINEFLSTNSEEKLIVAILAITILFNTGAFLEYNLHGHFKIKILSQIRIVAGLIGIIIKIIFVYTKSPLIYFAIAYVADIGLITFSLAIHYYFYISKKSFKLTYDHQYAKQLLKRCIPITLSTLSVVAYMRIDQIMIQHYLSLKEVGLYSAASKFNEAWLMLTYTLNLAALPFLSKLRSKSEANFERAITALLSLLIWSSIALGLIFTLLSPYILSLTFGKDYIESSNSVIILIWSSVFAVTNTVLTRYLIIMKMEALILTRSIFALLLNLILNTILIPSHGIIGSAIATLASLSISITLYFIGNNKSKTMFIIVIKSLAFHFRK